MLFAPGALTTRMPRALAAATSTLSTPVPARRDDAEAGRRVHQSRVHLGRAADEQRVGVREVARRELGRRARDRVRRDRSSQAGVRREASFERRGRAGRRRQRFSMRLGLRPEAAHVVHDVPDLARRHLAAKARMPAAFDAVADDGVDLAVGRAVLPVGVGQVRRLRLQRPRPSCRRRCRRRRDSWRTALRTASCRRRLTPRSPRPGSSASPPPDADARRRRMLMLLGTERGDVIDRAQSART